MVEYAFHPERCPAVTAGHLFMFDGCLGFEAQDIMFIIKESIKLSDTKFKEAAMKEYNFQATIEEDRKSVQIINDADDTAGYIEKDVLRKCEEKHTYSFTPKDGRKVTVGLKRRKLRDLNIANYIIAADETTMFMKEKAGKNLLRFRVKGNIGSTYMYIKEDDGGNMDVFIDGSQAAAVNEHSPEKVSITVNDEIEEDSIVFAVLVLMFFMFKLYKRESWHIEELLS